jgi:hypothetical protein
MTLTTPSFRRSSERQVTDPNETYVVEEDRLRNLEFQRYEEIGFSAAAASVPTERPGFEVLMDAIEADDRQFYDEKERSVAH